ERYWAGGTAAKSGTRAPAVAPDRPHRRPGARRVRAAGPARGHGRDSSNPALPCRTGKPACCEDLYLKTSRRCSSPRYSLISGYRTEVRPDGRGCVPVTVLALPPERTRRRTFFANLRRPLYDPIKSESVDPVRNPYAPGAGQRPPELAGRDRELQQFEVVLERVARGRPERSMVVTGLRG